METKFNESLKQKKKHLLRPGWQERLPIKPILVAVVVLLLLSVLVLVNRPAESVLNSAEMDVIKSNGVLRVGVDTGIEGLYQNGSGYERALCEALSMRIFDSTEGLTLVPTERYAAPWRMNDGEIDLCIMSMQEFPEEGYAHSTEPFFVDSCVLLGYTQFESLAGKTIAVLQETPQEALLYDYLEDVEPELVVRLFADNYAMRVALRAGTVDAICVPKTVAKSWHESRTQILSFSIGKIPYYAIAKKDSVLLSLCDELFYDWRRDGTFDAWSKEYGVEWSANG